MYWGEVGGSTEIFEINLLRTWWVYIESRVSPLPPPPPKIPHNRHSFWLLLEGKGVVCQIHDWFWKPEANRQSTDFDPFWTVSYENRFSVIVPAIYCRKRDVIMKRRFWLADV